MKSKAFLLMALSTFLFSIQGICIKWIGKDLPASEIAFLRGAGTLILITPYILSKGIGIGGKRPGMLLLRGVMAGLVLIFGFYTMQHLPLSTASLLCSLHPLLIPLIATVVLKEALHLRHFAALGLALGGTALVYISAFDGDSWTLIPALAGVLSSICYATTTCLVRSLRNSEDTWVIVNYVAIGSMLVTAPGFLAHPVMPTLTQYGLMGVIVLVSTLGLLAFTWALGHDSASKLGSLNSLAPVWAGIWGISFFNEEMTITMLAGGALILAGTYCASRLHTAPAQQTSASGVAAKRITTA